MPAAPRSRGGCRPHPGWPIDPPWSAPGSARPRTAGYLGGRGAGVLSRQRVRFLREIGERVSYAVERRRPSAADRRPHAPYGRSRRRAAASCVAVSPSIAGSLAASNRRRDGNAGGRGTSRIDRMGRAVDDLAAHGRLSLDGIADTLTDLERKRTRWRLSTPAPRPPEVSGCPCRAEPGADHGGSIGHPGCGRQPPRERGAAGTGRLDDHGGLRSPRGLGLDGGPRRGPRHRPGRARVGVRALLARPLRERSSEQRRPGRPPRPRAHHRPPARRGAGRPAHDGVRARDRSTFVVWLPADPEADAAAIVAPDGIHHLADPMSPLGAAERV